MSRQLSYDALEWDSRKAFYNKYLYCASWWQLRYPFPPDKRDERDKSLYTITSPVSFGPQYVLP